MYDHFEMTLPEVPAKRVLLWLRQSTEIRRLENLNEIIAVLDTYELNYTYVRAISCPSAYTHTHTHSRTAFCSRRVTLPQ